MENSTPFQVVICTGTRHVRSCDPSTPPVIYRRNLYITSRALVSQRFFPRFAELNNKLLLTFLNTNINRKGRVALSKPLQLFLSSKIPLTPLSFSLSLRAVFRASSSDKLSSQLSRARHSDRRSHRQSEMENTTVIRAVAEAVNNSQGQGTGQVADASIGGAFVAFGSMIWAIITLPVTIPGTYLCSLLFSFSSLPSSTIPFLSLPLGPWLTTAVAVFNFLGTVLTAVFSIPVNVFLGGK